jgi:CHAT domain-containing protein
VALNNAAMVYEAQGDLSRAAQILARSIEIDQKLGSTSCTASFALTNLAKVRLAEGSLDLAEQRLREASDILSLCPGLDPSMEARVLMLKGYTRWARGDVPGALKAMKLAGRIQQGRIAEILAIGSELQRLTFMESLVSEVDAIVSFHAQYVSDPEALGLALNTVLERKARVLDAAGDELAHLHGRSPPEDRGVLQRLRANRQHLASLEIAAAEDPERRAAIHAEFVATRAEADRLRTELSARNSEYRALIEPVRFQAVRARLPPRSALVEFVSYRPFDPLRVSYGELRYVAFLLRDGRQPSSIDLGPADEINEIIRRFRASLSAPSSGDHRNSGRELYERVMGPASSLLDGVEHVFLAPDDLLSLVPFGALVDDDGRYLVSRYTLTYLTTGRDLVRGRSAAPARSPPLLLGEPDFDLPRPGEGGAPAGAGSSVFSRMRFAPLPGTGSEVRAIQEILPDSQVLLGAEAKESELRQVAGPRILHLATHGFFLAGENRRNREARGVLLAPAGSLPMSRPPENPLVRSGLALASANQPKFGMEDGILTALETSLLDLSGTKLVVLSACETGVGETHRGTGVFGLRRAVTLAGAESLVMSLWNVPDVATSDFMVRYYERLGDGEGRSKALQGVQLEFLESARTAHPFFWASFILAGRWEPLS